eukprot:gene9871-6941_t
MGTDLPAPSCAVTFFSDFSPSDLYSSPHQRGPKILRRGQTTPFVDCLWEEAQSKDMVGRRPHCLPVGLRVSPTPGALHIHIFPLTFCIIILLNCVSVSYFIHGEKKKLT